MSWIRILSKIVKKDNKYQVQSEKGRNLGTYDTKEEAEKRLKQVEYFKHKKSAKTNPKIKKVVNKPSKVIKTKPRKVFTDKPNNNIKTTKKPLKTQNKSISKKYKIRTNTGEWPHQDVSLPVFEDLLEQGYNMTTFVAWPGACSFCKKMNGKTWTLQNLLATTEYEAPIFSHSHVNSYSKMKVWDKNGELDPVYVDYNGNITY